MLSLYGIYAAMQQICCVAACIDNIADMHYVNDMDTYESLVTQIVDHLRPMFRDSLKNKPHTSITKKLDDIGITVKFVQNIGFPNNETVTITHEEYTAVYNRMWPDIESDHININGIVIVSTSGNWANLIEVLTLLTLRQ